MPPSPLKLAFVVPRYGANIGGGAETLVRSIVLQLAAAHSSFPSVSSLEVWSTTASDHRTWSNDLPTGLLREEEVDVYRFPVDERDIDLFLSHEHTIAGDVSLSVEQQLEWLTSNVNSIALYEHIKDNAHRMDAIFFAPYLFPTSFWGPHMCMSKAILIPCLHDEPYAWQQVFGLLFRKVRGILFNAQPEKDLATKIYGKIAPSQVVGMGFKPLKPSKESAHRVGEIARLNHFDADAYFLYSGRKERGKNLDLLLSYWGEICPKYALVLIGSGEIDFCNNLPKNVVDLGFVSESQKSDLMFEALGLIQPSINESFSIVLMESWLCGTPVLVNADCAVTSWHVKRSGGGLVFSDESDFASALDKIVNSYKDSNFSELGERGKAYVRSEYNWDVVGNRFERLLFQVGILK